MDKISILLTNSKTGDVTNIVADEMLLVGECPDRYSSHKSHSDYVSCRDKSRQDMIDMFDKNFEDGDCILLLRKVSIAES